MNNWISMLLNPSMNNVLMEKQINQKHEKLLKKVYNTE